VPASINGSGFVQSEYKFPDGTIKTIKDDFFYKLKKQLFSEMTFEL
jgi:hypothetical protein